MICATRSPPLTRFTSFLCLCTEPEISDGANKGLGIMRDLLLPVKQAHPEISYADLWTLAGCLSIEFCGGPAIPFNLGRSDDADGAS